MGAQECRARLDRVAERRRVEHGQLGVVVQPVAGLDLGRGRARPSHPLEVAGQQLGQRAVRGGRACRPDAGRNPAAGRRDLLVAGAPRAEVELPHPVAAERGMGVAVDQTGDGGPAAGVVYGQPAVRRQHLVARADGGDLASTMAMAASSMTSTAPRSAPRSGAPAPAGEATCRQPVDDR